MRSERPYSMELRHTDWKWLEDTEKWIIAYEDDASRYPMSYDLYDRRSTRASIDVLENGISLYGVPDADYLFSCSYHPSSDCGQS